jgi:hypothetical protein
VALNGATIQGPEAWGAIGANFQLDLPMPLVVERAGVPLELQLRLGRLPLTTHLQSRGGAFLAVVRAALLMTLVAGLIIAWRRPRDPIALTASWFLLTCAVFNIALPLRIGTMWRALPAPVSALLWVPYASSLLFGAVLLTFVAVFPRRLPYAGGVLAFAWAGAAAAVARPLYNFADFVYRGTSLRTTGPGTFPLFEISTGYLAAAVVIAFLNYRHISDVNERRKLRAVVAGLAVAVLSGFPVMASFLLARQTNLMTTIFESPTLVFAAVALLAAPLSVTYAVLRHRLFDISFIVRQWLQYALARWAVLSIAPVLMAVLVIDLVAHGQETINAVLRRRGFLYASVAAVALAAYVQRKRWLDGIDRRFFRERHDGYAILREVAEQIRRSGSIDRVAPIVVARIEAALHPEFAALLVRDIHRQSYQTVAAAPVAYAPADLDAGSKLVALARVLEKPLDTSADGESWLQQQVQARDQEFLQRAGIDLLVPVVTQDDDLQALLVLGRKRSEEPYAREDYDLLVAIAENLGLLIPRSVPTPRAVGLEECGACGTCFDEGTRSCERDGRPLHAVGLPRMLASRYRLVRRIGCGGMGTVYEALDTALEKHVAIKVAREDLPAGWNADERLVEEAKVAARLVHPNVVTVLDFGVIDGRRPFLVMERLVGRTLRHELDDTAIVAPRAALAIVRAVCSAVDAAHRVGLVHRDLKPENIFLTEGDGQPIPKILDFGIAKPLSTMRDPLTRPSTDPTAVVGTIEYMAPEQCRGERVSPAWDLWSIALIAHEMLTGAPTAAPFFDWDPAGAFKPERPHCAAFFRSALSIDTTPRPSTGRTLANALGQAMQADGLVDVG